MFKKIGGLLMTLLGLALLVYSAARSLNFITLTLPPDKQILAYFGLAALDGGVIAWLLSFLYGSRGWQRAISLLMVGVDLIGAVAMFTFDTLLEAGQAGLGSGLQPEQVQTAILALSGVIALNIAATIAHHLTDPEKLREMAEEEAQDKIDDEELKQIKDNAATLAAQVSPLRALAWQERQRARLLGLAGIQPTIIEGKSVDLSSIPANPEREKDKVLNWWPFGKREENNTAQNVPNFAANATPIADTCAECGAPAGPGKGVNWVYEGLPLSNANPERLCLSCARTYLQPQEGEPVEEPEKVDPALVAAVLAAMTKSQLAHNGNGHNTHPMDGDVSNPKNLPGA